MREVGVVANPEHVEIVRRGARAIRVWREAHPGERLELSEARLEGANLEGAIFHGADLQRAILEGVNLEGAKLERANLDQRAHLNRWWAGIIAAPLSGLVRVIILIILANIRAGFICLRVLNLSVVIIPTHYRLPLWVARFLCGARGTVPLSAFTSPST
ncbi:hypothetical protein C2W62_07120 [Candidatus Entotheonella serta]|nr:hypothetical protein C2W62_07120 [Candidatus Entotheonella serta]